MSVLIYLFCFCFVPPLTKRNDDEDRGKGKGETAWCLFVRLVAEGWREGEEEEGVRENWKEEIKQVACKMTMDHHST